MKESLGRIVLFASMQIYREQASVHAAFLKFFEVKIAGIIKKYRYLQSFQML